MTELNNAGREINKPEAEQVSFQTDANFETRTENVNGQIEAKKKKSLFKKFLIIFLLINLLLVVAFLFYYFLILKPRYLSLDSQETPLIMDTQIKPLSLEEWTTVELSVKENLSLNSINQMLSPSQLSNPLENESPLSFYKNLEETYSLNSSKDSVDQTLGVQQKKSHFSLKLGAKLEDDNKKEHDLDLSLSYLGLEDLSSQETQVDIIANLSLGDVVLQDDGMDALHVSIINSFDNKAAINIEASDYLIVLLDTLIFPEKERIPGKIYVDSKDIYPFFGNYVQIESDFVELDENKDQLLNDFINFSENNFIDTFADLNKYVDTSKDILLLSDQSHLGVVLVTIDERLFLETVEEYFTNTKRYFESNQNRYEIICAGQNYECMYELGYQDKESLDASAELISMLFKFFRINRSGIVVAVDDLSFKGFYLDFVKRGMVLDMFNLPIDINHLAFSFYIDNLFEKQNIFSPKKIINFSDQPEFLGYAAMEQGNRLYSENKAFMRTLELDALKALLVEGGKFCNVWWSPEFCINELIDWEINASSLFDNTINMNYPFGSYSSDQQLSATIRSFDWEFEDDCFYDEESTFIFNSYEFYQDVIVDQNLHLRVSLNSDSEGGYFGRVCHLKEHGYSTRLPFAGEISLSAKGFTAEEALEKFSEALSGIRIK